jgi:hypothetical protein
VTFGFAMMTVGTLLLLSGVRNRSIAEVLEGVFSPKPGGAGEGTVETSEPQTTPEGGGGTGSGFGGSPAKQKKKEQFLAVSHPELKPGIRAAAAVVMAGFPGLQITATTNGTHANNSYHYKGRAVDLAGSTQEMNRAAKWIAKLMTGTLTEGIHNPGLSVDNHHSVPSSFWGEPTWSEHANHIHLAV